MVKWLVIIMASAVLLVLFVAEYRIEHDERYNHALTPHNPTSAESQRRNLSQTGVDDVQIPVETRQDYAMDNGLRVPSQ